MFRKVAHDFRQLKTWKSYATSNLLSRPNVLYVDIDEENNRISIGVLNSTTKTEIERHMRDKKIPTAVAVVMPPAMMPPPGDPPPNPGAGETLRNTNQLIPGVRIYPGNTLICTMGFNTSFRSNYYYSSDNFFVTNGHCMNTIGSNTGTIVRNQFGNVIGYEWRQSFYFYAPDYDCPPGGYRCALADAALIRYTVGWNGGVIARTTFSGTGTDTGSVTLDPFNPRWAIADSIMDHTLIQGRQLHKVGWNSGWTEGSVTTTCVDYQLFMNNVPTQFFWLCQWDTNFTTAGGDSGAPVFTYKFGSFPKVSLVGVIWAGLKGRSVFSFYPYVSWSLTRGQTWWECWPDTRCETRLSVSEPW